VTSAQFRERLRTRAELADVSLAPALVDKLEAYFRLLSIWNRRINLTAFDLDVMAAEAMDRLLIEPLAAARYALRHQPVLDIGSGGGSPALPFALAADASELTMIESRTRKSVFLREAAHTVGLADARVLTTRFADAISSSDLVSRFAAVTARAVRLHEHDWPRLCNALKAGGSVFWFHRRGAEAGQLPVPAQLRVHGLTSEASVSIYTKSA